MLELDLETLQGVRAYLWAPYKMLYWLGTGNDNGLVLVLILPVLILIALVCYWCWYWYWWGSQYPGTGAGTSGSGVGTTDACAGCVFLANRTLVAPRLSRKHGHVTSRSNFLVTASLPGELTLDENFEFLDVVDKFITRITTQSRLTEGPHSMRAGGEETSSNYVRMDLVGTELLYISASLMHMIDRVSAVFCLVWESPNQTVAARAASSRT